MSSTCRLVRDRALAMIFSARRRAFGESVPRTSCSPICEYHTWRWPISAYSRIRSRYALTTARAARAADEANADRRAGRQPLDIPLPRRGVSLVEVVDRVDQVPFRGGEHAEVRHVRVAAGLHHEVRGRRRGQIRGHDGGRAPEEGEGRAKHAAVANRNQMLDPALGLPFEDGHRIPAARCRTVLSVAPSRHLGPQRLARRLALGHRKTYGRRIPQGTQRQLAIVDPSLRLRSRPHELSPCLEPFSNCGRVGPHPFESGAARCQLRGGERLSNSFSRFMA